MVVTDIVLLNQRRVMSRNGRRSGLLGRRNVDGVHQVGYALRVHCVCVRCVKVCEDGVFVSEDGVNVQYPNPTGYPPFISCQKILLYSHRLCQPYKPRVYLFLQPQTQTLHGYICVHELRAVA